MLIFMWMYVFNISQKKTSVLSKTEDYGVVHTSSAPSRSPAPSIRMYA